MAVPLGPTSPLLNNSPQRTLKGAAPAMPARPPLFLAMTRFLRAASVADGMCLVTFAGLFAAATLSLGHLLDFPVPCGGGGGCESVAAHPSSRIFGVPIAFIGVAAYLFFLFLLQRSHSSPRARAGLVAACGCGAVASAALLVYSWSVIGATCAWCVVSGAAMGLLFLGAMWQWAPGRRGSQPWMPRRGLILLLALLTSVGLGLQAGMMRRSALRAPVSAERMAGVSQHELLSGAASLGPADAPVTIVMFTDFWCPGCRVMHHSLSGFQKANPAGVRLAYRHLPLWNIRGHEFSGTASALAEMASETGAFQAFCDTLLAQERPMGRADYLGLMSRLGFDPAKVEERMADPEDPAVLRVRNDMALAARLGIRTTPSFIVMIEGAPPVSADQRTLPAVLNSEPVLRRLVSASAARPQP
jgi:protein-disulfide isomerase/uncharacterized membrane protein